MSNEKGLDTFLCLKSDEELKELGYHKDDIGQVRADDDNALVCGISGRRHFVYLLPCVQIRESGVEVYFIDKQAMEDIQVLTKIKFKELGKRGLERLLERLLDMGLSIAKAKLAEKLDR